MTGLSPEAQALLDAGKSGLSPSTATKANVLASVENAIASGSVGSSAGGISATKLLLVLVVAAGIGGGLWLYMGNDAKHPAPVASEAVVQLTPAKITMPVAEEFKEAAEPTPIEESHTALPAPPILDSNPLPEEKVALPSSETRAKRKIKREPSKSISGMNTLLAERKLLVAAKGAIGKHDYMGARGILGVHKRKFPQGMLSAERDALRAISLCLDSQEDSGPAAAKRFLKKHGQSPLAPRVKNICKLP